MSSDSDRFATAGGGEIFDEIPAPAHDGVLTDTSTRHALKQADAIAVLRRETSELTTRLARATELSTAVTIERDGLARALKRRAEELTELRTELDSHEDSLRAMLMRASSSEAARVGLTEELAVAGEDNAALRHNLAECRHRLECREQELGELERRAGEWQGRDSSEVRALRWQLVTVQREAAARRSAQRELEEQRSGLERHVTELAQEQDALREDLEVLLGERRELLADLGAADAALVSVSAQRDQLRDEREQLVCEHDKSIESAQRELGEAAAAAESLDAQLDRVERRLAVRAGQLQAIRQSRSFRVALRLANAKHAVLHPRRARRSRAELPAGNEADAD